MDTYKIDGLDMTEEQAKDMLLKYILTEKEMPMVELNGETKPLNEYFLPSVEIPSLEQLEKIGDFCLKQDDFAAYSFTCCNIQKLMAYPYHILVYKKKRRHFLNIGAVMEFIAITDTIFDGKNCKEKSK